MWGQYKDEYLSGCGMLNHAFCVRLCHLFSLLFSVSAIFHDILLNLILRLSMAL
uniref:Uncharacterized protein n=1 Tax=Anguilla anguilla TaxID=7936 RepID=A0A0E9WHK9_ANGAN